ncbi:MAG: hypothetical protein LIO46_03970, partial [Clostridiales bacterium]|nr:hypothetical protein [Clostridiales bacterium]
FEGSELSGAGYATLTYMISVGGTKEKILQKDTKDSINVGAEQNPAIQITDADAVYLITVSDRDFEMGSLADFGALEQYSFIDDLKARTEAVAAQYQAEGFSYEAALRPSAQEQSRLFNAVSFQMGSEEDLALANEDLIALQRKQDTLNPAMVQRAYNAGRYAMIACSGGNLISRLYGMWTGEWGCRWNGAYTMDANVNLQVSGMNSGNCLSYGISYINFVLNQVEDWKENARKNFGFEDAIQVPCNTDGDSAISVEYNSTYAFQYWLDGASWMLDPIYELYQCYGDITVPTDTGEKQLLEDILLPLLNLQANFWDQLLTPAYYTDSGGDIHYQPGKTSLDEEEYYCIIPCYSPENMPANMESAITANATIDITAARRGFDMLIAVQEAIAYDGYEADTAKWTAYREKLPPYLYDDTGALKEWAANQFEENNEHRHVSHLYCAWPSNETQEDALLSQASFQVIENRNAGSKSSEMTQTHGWLHKGLVAARLKDRETTAQTLSQLLGTKVYYDSFMTDHNTHRGSNCYCTDTSLGIIGVVNEMLLYSDTGVIELLPALPADLKQGAVSGLMAKTQAEVQMEWDEGIVTAQIKSNIAQTIRVSCCGGEAREIAFAPGETKSLRFDY